MENIPDEMMPGSDLDDHDLDFTPLEAISASLSTTSSKQKKYLRNDSGNAESFVDTYGNDLRFLAARGEWLIWEGQRWRVDTDHEIVRLAQKHAFDRLQQAAAIKDESLRDAEVKYALRCGNANLIHSMIKMAQADSRVVISDARLDGDPFLLGVANGVVDLRTGKFRSADQADLITKSNGVQFDPTAKCQRWLSFLDEVLAGDTALIEYLQKAVGYCLSGSTEEHCFFFLHGGGCNGKSTFMEVLQALLGDYCNSAPQSLFTASPNGREPQSEVARLIGARVITGSEVEEGSRFAECRIKDMTGGDRMTARFLYAESFEFQPLFKLWMAGNHKPDVRGTDNGIWRRVRLIPFTVQIPENRRDPKLRQHLKHELPGILNWALEGCLKWQSDGGLNPPKVVLDAVKEYRGDEDLLGDFLQESIVPDTNGRIKKRDLFQAYKDWCESEGIKRPMFGKKFNKAMQDRGLIDKKTNGERLWIGVRLIVDLPAEERQRSLFNGEGSVTFVKGDSPPPPFTAV